MDDTTRYAVVMHFDSASGMVYEQGPRLENRRKATVERADWWAGRLRLLKHLVLPALARQKFQHFDTWALFDGRDESRFGAAWQFLEAAGVHCTCDGPAALRQYYTRAGARSGPGMRYLVVVHQDSDDLYGPDALWHFANHAPASEGQAWCFEHGHIYGLTCGRLALFDADIGGPPPFHAMTYTRAALSDESSWDGYRKACGYNVFHHQLLAIPKLERLPGRRFCVLVHGGNTTTAWENIHTEHHTGDEITEHKARHAVFTEYGLDHWRPLASPTGHPEAACGPGTGVGPLVQAQANESASGPPAAPAAAT